MRSLSMVVCPQPRKLGQARRLSETLNRGPVRSAGSKLVPFPAGGK